MSNKKHGYLGEANTGGTLGEEVMISENMQSRFYSVISQDESFLLEISLI